MRIKVLSISTKEGDNAKGHWISTIITGDDSAKCSTFDKRASTLKQGDIVEGETKKEGKYTQLLDGFTIEESPEPSVPTIPEKTTPRYGKSLEELATERRSIERQISLKMAVECGSDLATSNGSFMPTDEKVSAIIGIADRFYRWISSGEPYKAPPNVWDRIT